MKGLAHHKEHKKAHSDGLKQKLEKGSGVGQLNENYVGPYSVQHEMKKYADGHKKRMKMSGYKKQ